ncbi:hypothetical protein VRRI112168_00620 [Vreelandella rituensis]|nr:hypothetical protein [Halomonas rituensis]
MSCSLYQTLEVDVRALKKKAWQHKRLHGLTHNQALNGLALELGFNSWSDFTCRHRKALEIAAKDMSLYRLYASYRVAALHIIEWMARRLKNQIDEALANPAVLEQRAHTPSNTEMTAMARGLTIRGWRLKPEAYGGELYWAVSDEFERLVAFIDATHPDGAPRVCFRVDPAAGFPAAELTLGRCRTAIIQTLESLRRHAC